MGTPPIHLPLADCYLCADCSTISNNAVRCPSCASEHGMMSLGTVLGRTDAPQANPALPVSLVREIERIGE